ncbi:MAG TPA: GNAT family N-acetyltransferase [Mycobacteriales bacterium]|nr:GNAT family N-acetyltransferase [Mycobacteriales bacterium]
MAQERIETVTVEPWSEADFDLMCRLNTAEMTRYIGGPPTAQEIRSRHRDYVKYGYPVIVLPSGERVGEIGYWDRDWQGRTVWEMGWKVVPEFQRRGIASAAVRHILPRIMAEQKHDQIHAFPPVANAASNSVCRTTGFQLIGPCDFEFPEGNWLRCNDWRIDLTPVQR